MCAKCLHVSQLFTCKSKDVVKWIRYSLYELWDYAIDLEGPGIPRA